jgi:hypothetical protein
MSRPGQLQEVMAGEVSGMAISQGFLVAVSLYVAVASVMVFLSLVLNPTLTRWTNGWQSPQAENDAVGGAGRRPA